MPSTARITILLKPEEKRTLMARASRERVSVGELVRGELFAGRRDEDRALMAAVDTLRESSKAARKTLDHLLQTLAERDKDAQTRAEATRSSVRKQIQSWPPDEAARVRELFFGDPEARS